jgi:hypothetical protein
MRLVRRPSVRRVAGRCVSPRSGASSPPVGDGDITGPGSMWLIGPVQSAAAALRLASAIRRRSRLEELVIGEEEPRLRRAVSSFAGSPSSGGEQTGRPSTWQHVGGAEHPRRCLVFQRFGERG